MCKSQTLKRWVCAIRYWLRRSGNRLQLSLAVGSTSFPFQVFVIRYTGKNKAENSWWSTSSFTAALRFLTLTLLICHLSLVLLVTQICKRSQVLVIYACGPRHKIRQSFLTDLLARKKLGLFRQPSLLGERTWETPPKRERKNPTIKGASEKTSKY